MSKKDSLRKKAKQVNKEEVKKTHEMDLSKKEKKITAIFFSIGIIAALVIFCVTLILRNDKDLISKRFNFLDKDHVFEYINYEQYKTKIQNGETFLVFFVDEEYENANYITYYIDDIVKALEEDHQKDYPNIYLFLTTDIEKNVVSYLKKNIDENILDKPNVVFYQKGFETYSADKEATSRFNQDKYNNYYELLKDFFNLIYPKPEVAEE